MKLIVGYLTHPYTNIKIQEIDYSLTALNVMISLVLIIGQLIKDVIDYPVTIILLAAASYFVGWKIMRFRVITVMNSLFG